MADKKNPYPKGSYRAKAWDRREREKAEKEPKDKKPKKKGDEVDEEVEKRNKLGYFRQTTDSNND